MTIILQLIQVAGKTSTVLEDVFFIVGSPECLSSVDLLLSHSSTILELTHRCLEDEERTDSLTKLAFGPIADLADRFPLGQLKQLFPDEQVARELRSKSHMHMETNRTMWWACKVSTYFLCFLEFLLIKMTCQHRWCELKHSRCFGILPGFFFLSPFHNPSFSSIISVLPPSLHPVNTCMQPTITIFFSSITFWRRHHHTVHESFCMPLENLVLSPTSLFGLLSTIVFVELLVLYILT